MQYAIHMRDGDDADMVIFTQNPEAERATKDFKDYKKDGFKELAVFEMTLVSGESDLPYSIESL